MRVKDADRDILAGIQNYTINQGKMQMVLTLVVGSSDVGLDKYKEVYDKIKKFLRTEYPCPEDKNKSSQKVEQIDKEKCLSIGQESLKAIQNQIDYLNGLESLDSYSQRDLVALVEAQAKMLLAIKEFLGQ